MCWVMPAGLAGGDLGLADRVEQRGLAVVDVAHDRDDRRADDEVGLGVVEDGLLLDLLGGADDLDLALELLGEHLDGLVGERLGQGRHLALLHQLLDHLGGADAEGLGDLAHGRAGVDLERRPPRSRASSSGRLVEAAGGGGRRGGAAGAGAAPATCGRGGLPASRSRRGGASSAAPASRARRSPRPARRRARALRRPSARAAASAARAAPSGAAVSAFGGAASAARRFGSAARRRRPERLQRDVLLDARGGRLDLDAGGFSAAMTFLLSGPAPSRSRGLAACHLGYASAGCSVPRPPRRASSAASALVGLARPPRRHPAPRRVLGGSACSGVLRASVGRPRPRLLGAPRRPAPRRPRPPALGAASALGGLPRRRRPPRPPRRPLASAASAASSASAPRRTRPRPCATIVSTSPSAASGSASTWTSSSPSGARTVTWLVAKRASAWCWGRPQ